MTSAATMAFSHEDFRNNFPFETICPRQFNVLKEVCDAFNSGFKFIILEAPTGFGKSPVAIAIARTLGSSYICSATRDLQTQYVKDFPFLRAVKGMGNFSCLVKEDFAINNTNVCGTMLDEYIDGKMVANKYNHTVDYGPCRDGQIGYEHQNKTCRLCYLLKIKGANSIGRFHDGCQYRTFMEDYEIKYQNTDDERIEIRDLRRREYAESLKISNRNNNNFWIHTKNFGNFEKIRNEFIPCPYYDQLNKGLIASHSILNYANFQIFLRANLLPKRELLVLDEGHSIETQIVEHVGITISKKFLKRYIATRILENITYDYDNSIEKYWLPLLIDIYEELDAAMPNIQSYETRINAMDYLRRIRDVINGFILDPLNWIVSEIDREQGKVEFKPLNVSEYCKHIFEKCNRMLIMSATILDINTFCRNVGLDVETVKYISVDSDFPIQNRPIYQMDVAYLNYDTLQQDSIQKQISHAIDNIMTSHNKEKGIIHCTSYKQVNFIETNVSRENRRRLIRTDPDKFNGREEVISKHFTSVKPTVLISPSLHTGLDLKDESSRFQIIVKVPYPNISDRWIKAKGQKNGAWYNLQASVKLVQAYGRSVRSRDDWAKTYILDSGFKDFLLKNRLPKWYTEAIAIPNTRRLFSF